MGPEQAGALVPKHLARISEVVRAVLAPTRAGHHGQVRPVALLVAEFLQRRHRYLAKAAEERYVVMRVPEQTCARGARPVMARTTSRPAPERNGHSHGRVLPLTRVVMTVDVTNNIAPVSPLYQGLSIDTSRSRRHTS